MVGWAITNKKMGIGKYSNAERELARRIVQLKAYIRKAKKRIKRFEKEIEETKILLKGRYGVKK